MTIIPRPVPKLEPSSTHGWVYIIKSDSGHYKIGKARRPDKRAGSFSLQLPFKIEVIHIIECEDYTLTERTLHWLFDKHRVNGEWFTLSPKMVEWIAEIEETRLISLLHYPMLYPEWRESLEDFSLDFGDAQEGVK